jgi:hypothetical protein
MSVKPIKNTNAGVPIPVPPAATGFQLGWNKGNWVVIKGNAGSQCQTRAESQALADQLNGIVSFATKQGKKV